MDKKASNGYYYWKCPHCGTLIYPLLRVIKYHKKHECNKNV